MTVNWQISRRTALRGLGAAVALPLLDAMQPRAAAAAEIVPPRRMAFLFVPNGANMDKWTPNREGYDFQWSPILQPLAPFRQDVMVLSGLTHDKGRANGDGPGDHARSASVFLTGAQPRKTDGSNIRVGVSVDQVAAQRIGRQSPFPSLELGCERGRDAGGCDSGYSCAYSSNISWSSETSPVGKEINPRLVFERLFSNARGSEVSERQNAQSELQKSILDFVAEDARRLQGRLGQADQRKLDEYLTGVREIERRVAHADRENRAAGVDGLDVPDGIPEDYQEHLRLMSDMMVLAFQSDMTRISTFMFANAASNRSYRPIGVADGHHDLSHHGNNPGKLQKIADINRFHIRQFAYLLGRLKSIREGEQTLLDQCMIVYGSGISDGNRHNNEDLPIILAGHGGGSLHPGRHVRVAPETPMCNLYLSLLDRVDCPVSFLGDSTGRLTQL